MRRLKNRREAGRLLALRLRSYANRSDVLVLGLPRGGVPVAFEIATALNLPLDVCIVRKLGVPDRKELAMGAIGSGDVIAVNPEIIDSWNISPSAFQQVLDQERQELQRRNHLYRETKPVLNVRDRTIILVDDGIATGSTLLAALATLKQQNPHHLIVVVPVAPRSIYPMLKNKIDRFISLITPQQLSAISCWYEDFSQTSDQDVQLLLETQSIPYFLNC